MIKDAMEKNAGTTAADREMAVLKEHFPGCFHGEEFDLEAFARLVGKGAKVVREGYGLSFLGRDYGRLVAARETETVLVPDEAHNAKPENRDSRNLYITGDNLDALKHLLGSYAGAVKCIYIDPPYNTGSDGFVYNDSFSFSAPELAEKLGVSEEESARVLDLTHRSSASHSAWLLFLYPRLLLARELLASDGVIFISIDDNEQANLKLLCDEVFGEEAFIGTFIWKKRQNVDSRTKNGVSSDHDFLLCFGRTLTSRIKGKASDKSKYSNPDNDPRGDWMSDNLVGLATESQRPNLHYPLLNPSTGIEYPCPPMGWRYERSRMAELIANGEILFPPEPTGRPRRKKFLKDVESEYTGLSTILQTAFSTNGTRELRELFGGNEVFDFPKPVDFIKLVVNQGTESNADNIVLDFFSGSATTAEAVMRLNAEDNGNRRFLLVQWPEVCKEDSEAQRAGYRTIDEIGRARIEKAAAKIRVESPLFHGDLGFKHYRIAAPTRESVAKMWDYKPDSLVEDSSLLAEFGEATVLATWLAHDGYGLSAEPAEVDFAGYKGRFIGRHLYFTRPGLTDEAVLALCERIETDPAFNPENLVLFGYSFPWSALEHLRINLARSKSLAKNLVVRMDVRY